jgi:hypothetical protein
MVSMPIFGSSGKTSNPLGNLGVLAGLVGAAGSVILWWFRFQPSSTILGRYSPQIAGGGPIADQLRVLAAAVGLMAVIAGIAGGLGGRGNASTVAALLLGVVGLSYPVLTYLNLVTRFVPNPIG